MTVHLIRMLAAAAMGVSLLANPATAQNTTPAPETKPLKLKSLQRKPVASSATRTASAR